MTIKKICVVGMGYVGLTLSVVLADVGFKVYGIELNKEIVKLLNTSKPHFYETQLEFLLARHVNNNLLIDSVMPQESCDVYIISVGTPLLKNEKKPNINYIKQALIDVSKHMSKGCLIILRSTVPVGTTRNVAAPLLEKHSNLSGGKDFYLVFAPERTLEGKALIELRTNSQIIGGLDDHSVSLAAEIFRKITPTIVTVSSLETAEIIKLIDNSYRDIKFAYANEIAILSEKMGLDAGEIINAANIHYPRNNIPVPSPGVGGACLSKDPYILIDDAKYYGYTPQLIKTARALNECIPSLIVQRIKKQLDNMGKDISNSKIMIIGFAFKGQPETSDMRDSTTLWLINELKKYNDVIFGYDPIVPAEEIEKLGIKFTSVEKGSENADCIMFMNNHPSYSNLDPYKIISNMNNPCIFYDSWRVFDPKIFKDMKDVYYGGVGF